MAAMNPTALRSLLVLTLAVPLGGCISVSASRPEIAVAPPAGAQVLDRLYCGRDVPEGGQVSDDEWATFVADVVTPRFPHGVTVFQARGQWLGADGRRAHETAMVIEVAHPDNPDDDRAVGEIATAYKQRFHQEAVLRIRQAAGVMFY